MGLHLPKGHSAELDENQDGSPRCCMVQFTVASKHAAMRLVLRCSAVEDLSRQCSVCFEHDI